MPVGITTGLKADIRTGIRTGIPGGIYAAGGAPVADQDATSGWYVPSSAAQFAALGIAAPSNIWLLQEASGNPADSVGGITLTATNTPLYQQPVAGWTRKGVGFTEAAGQRIAAAAGVGPNVGAQSVVWLAYIVFGTNGAGVRDVCGPNIAAANMAKVQANASATTLRANFNATTANGVSAPVGAGVMPVVVLVDRTGSRAMVYTGQEKIVGTYNALIADGMKGLGSAGGTSFLGTCVYMVAWTDASAELSDAQVKTRLQALNIPIPWT